MNKTSAPTRKTTAELIASGAVSDHHNPFALPRGPKGRLAGWYMSLPDRQHREVIDRLRVDPYDHMLEIGCGPGQILAAVHKRQPLAQLIGVDPSELMIAAARRRNPTAQLQLGAAASLPVADATIDTVVSVNNVAMWPDVNEALDEIHRVLKPGGRVFVFWHGGHDPRGHQRRLVMDAARTAALDKSFTARFELDRQCLRHSELWVGRVAAAIT